MSANSNSKLVTETQSPAFQRGFFMCSDEGTKFINLKNESHPIFFSLTRTKMMMTTKELITPPKMNGALAISGNKFPI
jgi:hypothetical protein